MWAGYSTKEAAELVGLCPSIVRTCLRLGLLDAAIDVLPLHFGFQDLKVLRTVKTLLENGVRLQRITRELIQLKARLGSSLARLSIESHNGHVVVRDAQLVWRADTGQLLFSFQFDSQAGEMSELPQSLDLPAPEFMVSLTADEWFDKALQSEESDPKRARSAYQQVLRQRPECTESLINLGRLHAESEELSRATEFFEQALSIDPREATALYNLGVIAQDSGNDTDAINYYEAALASDRELAEAHYNLATIFDRSGDARMAIRHINEFRKLSKRR